MSDVQQAAFLIGGDAYPVPTMFRLADPVLVREITGLEWDEFDAHNQAQNEARARGEQHTDPLVMIGLIAVAVWQRNPSWKRERVIRFVEQIDISSLDSVGPAEDEVVPAPPAAGGAHESQNGSANKSGDDSDPVTTPPAPGLPLSAVSTG